MEGEPTGLHTPWYPGTWPLTREPLSRDLATDVCVVGGGIAGLSVAYRLSRAGLRVVVLESRRLGAGDTGSTTAHLSSVLDEGFSRLETIHGADGARHAYQSHQDAIEEIAGIVRDERLDCDLERLDGYLFAAPGDDPEQLDRELTAARQAGFADAERLEAIPGATFASGPCLRFPRQGRFHPLKYLAGLAAAVDRLGGRIFTSSHVSEVERGREPAVRTRGGVTVRAGALVIATNVPIHDRVLVSTREEPYRTYALAAPVPCGSVPDALYWDTADPYHYVRLHQPGGSRDLLIVGGEDHRTGEGPAGDEPWRRLADWARRRFPIGDVVHRWSGQVMEPVDGLAYIGRDPLDPERVFLASGDSGHGMTHGALAGILISSLILGREQAWSSLYDPLRLRPLAAPDFVAAGLHVGCRYLEWLTGSEHEVASADAIPPGAGRIVRRDGLPLAVYRDQAGALSERSAVCPHLGCLVHWNEAEKSWDCPCHGSRFTPYGEVVHGPARRPLRFAGVS